MKRIYWFPRSLFRNMPTTLFRRYSCIQNVTLHLIEIFRIWIHSINHTANTKTYLYFHVFKFLYKTSRAHVDQRFPSVFMALLWQAYISSVYIKCAIVKWLDTKAKGVSLEKLNFFRIAVGILREEERDSKRRAIEAEKEAAIARPRFSFLSD